MNKFRLTPFVLVAALWISSLTAGVPIFAQTADPDLIPRTASAVTACTIRRPSCLAPTRCLDMPARRRCSSSDRKVRISPASRTFRRPTTWARFRPRALRTRIEGIHRTPRGF